MYDDYYDEYPYDLYDQSPIVYDKIDMGETTIYYSYWRDHGLPKKHKYGPT